MFEYAAFKDRWDNAVDKLKEEVAAEKAARKVPGAEGQTLETAAKVDPVEVANPARFKQFSSEYWEAFAAQLIRQYVKLVPEGTTAQGVASLIEDSHLKEICGTEGRNCVIVNYEADVASEAFARPGECKPPRDAGDYKLLIQGALAGRGAQKNKDNECVLGPQPCGSNFVCYSAAAR